MRTLQDDKRPVLIVGGGVAGCTLAYELSKRGRRVVLLEAGHIGAQGASSVPAALLNPYRGRSARASEEDKKGLEAMWALVGELRDLGLDHGVHQTGVLRIASNKKQAKTWRGRDGVRWLDHELPAAYHAPFGGFLVERGGWLEPHKFLHALIEAAKQRGAVVREECEVTGLEAGKEHKIHTTQGTFSAQTVVLCVGASLNPDLPLPELERVAGDVVGFDTDVDLPYPLAGAVYGVRCEERIYVGGNHRPAGEEDGAAPQQLRRAGGWFVPALKEAAHVSTWTGVRAKTEDHTPLVRELSPDIWFFGALAGRGFLCSARLSRKLAEAL